VGRVGRNGAYGGSLVSTGYWEGTNSTLIQTESMMEDAWG